MCSLLKAVAVRRPSELGYVCMYTKPCVHTCIYLFLYLLICVRIKNKVTSYCLTTTSFFHREKSSSHYLQSLIAVVDLITEEQELQLLKLILCQAFYVFYLIKTSMADTVIFPIYRGKKRKFGEVK